jgi:phosphoribulokinase
MTCIAICGDSASGKSRLANWLAFLFYAPLLECDRYHKWERNDPHWQQYTQLNPEANDLALLEQDIRALKNGETIYRREYDHETGTFTAPKAIFPEKSLVVCGLHTLMCDLSLFDLTIFLDTDDDLKLNWKITRDTSDRGYTLDQVMQQIQKRYGEYEKYIEPLRAQADVVIKRSATSREVIVQRERPGVQHIINELRTKETL